MVLSVIQLLLGDIHVLFHPPAVEDSSLSSPLQMLRPEKTTVTLTVGREIVNKQDPQSAVILEFFHSPQRQLIMLLSKAATLSVKTPEALL